MKSYSINPDDSATIINYNEPDIAVIPSTLGGKTVTAIGDNAFSNKGLTSASIPDTVKSIGVAVFSHNRLTTISIPASVTFIDMAAFNDNQLPDNKAIVYARNSDGTENQAQVVSYGGISKTVIIPKNVSTILAWAFSSDGLTSVRDVHRRGRQRHQHHHRL